MQQSKSVQVASQQAKIERKSDFTELQIEDIRYFEKVLSQENVIQDDVDVLQTFNTDFTKKYIGNAKVVLTPTSADQISAILAYCNERKIAVVPQGGNTGLVGGSVPVNDEIVLSLKKLNNIKSFDPVTGVLHCESGCILELLQDYVREQGYMMPLDLGAKGSCMIGGNISTNAGGIKFIKYGSMHANTLGLKAILSNGQAFEEYDYTNTQGYGLKHMFIGSEGTLGVITDCAIKCYPIPKYRQVCMLGTNSYEDILNALQKSKGFLSDSLSAIEYMDWASVKFSLDYLQIENPFSETKYQHYLLIETVGNEDEESAAYEKVLSLFETLEGHYEDAILCESEQQVDRLWKIREAISLATAQYGLILKFDVSLNSQFFDDIVQKTQEIVGDQGVVIGHGHIGDGNLHLNCAIQGFNDKELALRVQQQIQPFIFSYIKEKRGSISAEHGIGQQKPHYLNYSKSDPLIQRMRDLKMIFDPKGILNPYKVLPSPSSK